MTSFTATGNGTDSRIEYDSVPSNPGWVLNRYENFNQYVSSIGSGNNPVPQPPSYSGLSVGEQVMTSAWQPAGEKGWLLVHAVWDWAIQYNSVPRTVSGSSTSISVSGGNNLSFVFSTATQSQRTVVLSGNIQSQLVFEVPVGGYLKIEW